MTETSENRTSESGNQSSNPDDLVLCGREAALRFPEYLSTNTSLAPNTQILYRQVISRYFEQNPEASISAIQRFISKESRRKTSVVKPPFGPFLAMIGHGRMYSFLTKLRKKERIKQAVDPTKQERLDLIRCVKDEETRVALMISLITGARIHEVAKIHRKDIFEKEGEMWVFLRTKGGKVREFPLGWTSKYIMAYADTRWAYLFLSFDEVPERESEAFRRVLDNKLHLMRSYIRRAIQADNLRPFSTHRFRAGALQDWEEAGYSLREIQYMAGHARLDTTLGYLRKVNIDKVAVVKKVWEGHATA